MEKKKLIKIACIIFYVIKAIFTIVSFSTSWRRVVDKRSSEWGATFDLFGGYTVFSTSGEEATVPLDTGVSIGYTGDKAVAALFILAFILYIINIFAIVISMVARAFPEKASFIHPILCFIATLSLIIGCIIFGINKKEGWVWSDSPSTSNGVVIFKQGYNDVNLFPPRDFEYYNSIGVYIAVVAILLSIVSIVLSAAAAVMIGRGMKMNIGASSAPPPSSTSSGTRSS